MSILPARERFAQRISKSNEVVERAAAFIIFIADCCFGQIEMTVTARIIAFAEQCLILFVRERRDMQPVRRAESHLCPEKNTSVRPGFGEKIIAFVQANSVNGQRCRDPSTKISRQTFSRRWQIFQSRHFLIQMAVIQFVPQRLDAKIDIVLVNSQAVSLFFSKAETRTVVVSVNARRFPKKSFILRRTQIR